MNRWTFHVRSAMHHWRSNLAVALGVAVGGASLTGALIVGDSMRGSLRELALGRLGRVTHALTAQRFFRAALADDIAEPANHNPPIAVAPLILLRGGLTHAEKRTRVEGVGVLGVDDRFWRLDSIQHDRPIVDPEPRQIILNQPLARELQAAVGDDLLVRLAKPGDISTETLLGRRDDATASLRLTVAAILPAEGLAAFDLNPTQTESKNAFIPLATLQRTLNKPGRASALLASSGESAADTGRLQAAMRRHAALADVGLAIRVNESNRYLSVESDALLIPPRLEQPCIDAAAALGIRPSPILAHLANAITLGSPGQSARSIPWSTVVAIEPDSPTFKSLSPVSGSLTLAPGDILLNSWAAADLDARSGDRIILTYYLAGDRGKIETRSATFTLRGVVPLEGAAADPGFVPEYEGITNARSLADWNPPFPIDLSVVRDKDDAYWKHYRTTPKAFVTIEDGQRLWASDAERFGRLTSIRIHANQPDEDIHLLAERFAAALLQRLDADRLGFTFQPIREQILQSSRGGTDFGVLFVSFSFFLILAAAMLVALLFRLGVERRAHEVGLLLSFGFTPRAVGWMLLMEGLLLAAIGGIVGLLGAFGYAWLMLEGLRTWWSAAVNVHRLQLFVEPATVVIGFAAGLALSTASIAWSVRGLARRSARGLIDGRVGESLLSHPSRKGRAASLTAIVALSLAVALAFTAARVERAQAVALFFGGGSAMLVACLAAVCRWLRGRPTAVVHVPGAAALFRIGSRNARRNVGRSLLTVALIGSAVFIVVSLEAFRLDADAGDADHHSGTGGFSLVAESAVPLPFDATSREGRDSLGISDPRFDAGVARLFAMRLRPGDETSCLNLYRPTQPRIVGASDEFIARGGFRFASSIAESESEKSNPWTLLHRTFPDGAIPAVGDEAAVTWQLHLGLGRDLVVRDESGRDVRLRFVALLKGSILQGEIVVADGSFIRLFPSIGGRAFFLVESPAADAADIERRLEDDLSPFGFDASRAADRLAGYFAVQNTYISTFQTLGGLGLLLGTGGLAAVLLRNIWERRRELALMRTVGFAPAQLAAVVLVENAALLLAGVASGALAAAIAVVPVIRADASVLPWMSLAATLLAVLVVGMGAGSAATLTSLRAPLIPALRSE